MIRVEIFPSIQDYFSVNTFLFSMRVDTDVAKNAKTELSNFLSMIR